MLIPSPRQETCWRKVAYAQAKLSPFVATMQRVRLSMAREFESSLKKNKQESRWIIFLFNHNL